MIRIRSALQFNKRKYLLDALKRQINSFANQITLKNNAACGTIMSSGLFLGLGKSDHDEVFDADELKDKYVHRDELDWKERLDLMWRRDRYGKLSPELEFCYDTATAGLVAGAILGAFKESREVYMKFMAANKYTMFKHPREAQAIMQEQITYHMMKGAIRWGMKVGISVTCYVSMCQSAHTIRNYVNPLDHTAVGFITGATFRTMGGPRAMLSAGIIGGAMGLFEGIGTWSLYKLTGESISERWLRELQELHTANAAVDKEKQIESANQFKGRRMTEEEWTEKQLIEENENENKKSPLFSAFAVNVFQRLKELAAPSNIEITSESLDNNSSQIRNSNDNSSPNTVNKISSDDIR